MIGCLVLPHRMQSHLRFRSNSEVVWLQKWETKTTGNCFFYSLTTDQGNLTWHTDLLDNPS